MLRRTFLGTAALAAQHPQKPLRPNVLFITIDDLRPQLGCYGDRQVQTPHLDSLARRSVLFERAYCQQALCGPSRSSFLTGKRPNTIGVHDIQTHFRERNPHTVTLPQSFKNAGYLTRGFYKVFHLAGFDPAIGNLNDPPSWTLPHWLPSKSVYGPQGQATLEASYRAIRAAGKTVDYVNIPRSFAVETPDVADEDLSDGEMATAVIDTLRERKGQPFFLAAGFYKPHLPYVPPKRYWDLYDETKLQLPSNQHPPADAPPFALEGTRELRSYVDIPKDGPISEALGKRLLRAYLASISYVDAQVGRLLAELDRLGLRDNTIIVVLGDNGYQLGEHNMWGSKHTNFETSARVPLIISAPGQSTGRAKGLVELLDVYPTLQDLCGLPLTKDLEGRSLQPQLRNPNLTGKPAAFTQYPRGGYRGASVRTESFRFTQWTHAQSGHIVQELYDHRIDPDENRNIAALPAHAQTIVAHQTLLRSL
jgi:arylsulfatase A-like enzyme